MIYIIYYIRFHATACLPTIIVLIEVKTGLSAEVSPLSWARRRVVTREYGELDVFTCEVRESLVQ